MDTMLNINMSTAMMTKCIQLMNMFYTKKMVTVFVKKKPKHLTDIGLLIMNL